MSTQLCYAASIGLNEISYCRWIRCTCMPFGSWGKNYEAGMHAIVLLWVYLENQILKFKINEYYIQSSPVGSCFLIGFLPYFFVNFYSICRRSICVLIQIQVSVIATEKSCHFFSPSSDIPREVPVYRDADEWTVSSKTRVHHTNAQLNVELMSTYK